MLWQNEPYRKMSFAFPTKMVGDALLTERYIKLHKSLLELYKTDAKAG